MIFFRKPVPTFRDHAPKAIAPIPAPCTIAGPENHGRGHAAAAVGNGRDRAARDRVGDQRAQARGGVAAGRHRARAHARRRRHPDQGAAGRGSASASVNRAVGAIAAATRAGTSFVFGYLGGGALPYELKVARRRIRAGAAGAAGAPGDERAHHAPVLLAHPAAGRARLLLGSCSARSASAARSGLRPPPTSSSAWSRRRCSSGPISRGSRAASCSS